MNAGGVSNSLFRRMMHGAGYAFLGSIFLQGISFLYQILVTRILGPDKYGIISLSNSIVLLVAQFSLLGLGSGIVFFVAQYLSEKKQLKNIISSVLALLTASSIIFFVGTFLFAYFFVEKIYPFAQMQSVLIILCFCIPLLSLQTFFDSIFIAAQASFSLQILRLLPPIVRLLSIPLVLYFTSGNIILMALLIVVSYFLPQFYNVHIFFKKIISLKELLAKDTSEKFLVPLLQYSLPNYLSATLHLVYKQIDMFMVGYFLTQYYAGLYQTSISLSNLLGFAPSALTIFMLPNLSVLYSQKKNEEAHKLNIRVFGYVIYVTCLIVVPLTLFAQELLSFFYGDAFGEASESLIYLSLAFVFQALYVIPGNIISGKKRPILWFYIAVSSAVLNIIFNYMLIPLYGISGAAFSTCISSFSAAVLSIIISSKLTHEICFPFKFTLQLILTFIIVLVTLFFSFDLSIRIIFLLLFIILSTILLWKIQKHDCKMILKLIGIKIIS